MSLESAGDWDQFKANEQRFGLKSDYDENMYTTTIDRSNPLYRMREAEAERIVREIEESTSNNTHVREERGFREEDGALDEDDRYVIVYFESMISLHLGTDTAVYAGMEMDMIIHHCGQINPISILHRHVDRNPQNPLRLVLHLIQPSSCLR